MIYLDNGATTYPKPQEVKNSIVRALNQYGANPGRSGYRMSIDTGEQIYRCRKRIADFFGADGPECISFQPSCTQAINVVLKGVLKSGDHVLISDVEHNAVVRPLKKLQEKGITYTAVQTIPENNDLTVNAFRQAITPKTKLIVCTHGSNVFGFRLPVERIAALAHFYGIKICVDCAQTGGIVPINIQKSGIDYLCCAGHKGLYGPMGTGILILRQGDVIDTLVEGGTGTQSHSQFQPLEPPERYESGTQNISGIIGLGAGIEFVARKGVETIYAYEMRLIEQLYTRLVKLPEVILYTSKPKAPYYVPVLSFTIVNADSEEVGEFLAKNGIAVRCGMHCAPMAHEKMGTKHGTVRVTPSAFTKESDMDFLYRKIKAFIMQSKR